MTNTETNEGKANIAGYASGGVKTALQLEGLAIFAATLVFYWQLDGNWWWFLALFLWPDLAFFGYLRSQRFGAVLYDVLHSYTGPVAAGLIAYITIQPQLILFALIWTAHIGADRCVGYGLKYPSQPEITHLGVKAKSQTQPSE